MECPEVFEVFFGPGWTFYSSLALKLNVCGLGMNMFNMGVCGCVFERERERV